MFYVNFRWERMQIEQKCLVKNLNNGWSMAVIERSRFCRKCEFLFHWPYNTMVLCQVWALSHHGCRCTCLGGIIYFSAKSSQHIQTTCDHSNIHKSISTRLLSSLCVQRVPVDAPIQANVRAHKQQITTRSFYAHLTRQATNKHRLNQLDSISSRHS